MIRTKWRGESRSLNNQSHFFFFFFLRAKDLGYSIVQSGEKEDS